MIFKITRTVCLPLVCIFVLSLILFKTPAECDELDCNTTDVVITIDVAPNTLNIQSQGEVVTVHTDIGYSVVAGSTVTLNGIEIDHWKADNRGYFVAKFIMDEIKKLALDELQINDYNTFQLEGETTTGDSFCGQQDIMIVNNVPVGGQ